MPPAFGIDLNRAKTLWGACRHRLAEEGVVKASGSGIRALKALLFARPQPAGRKDPFDAVHGTDTDGIVPLWKLRIDSPHIDEGVRYQASEPEFIRQAIAALPLRSEEFIFIDLGSGKGRTLLVASEFPFRQVIGVEFSRELHEVAVANIETAARANRPCRDVRSICADAALYDFPREDTVLYLYNPFGKPVLRKVIERLLVSLEAAPRRIFIIYSNPVQARLFDELDRFERLDLPVEAAIYRSVDQPGIRSV